jgi:hypothetical protein
MTKAPTTSTPLGRDSCGNHIDCDVASTDGCAYKSGGKTFVARCNMDFYGSDLAIAFTDNLAECIQQCVTTQNCKSVSWSTGTCYMKNSIPQGDFSQWVQGMFCNLFIVVNKALINYRCLPCTVICQNWFCYIHVRDLGWKIRCDSLSRQYWKGVFTGLRSRKPTVTEKRTLRGNFTEYSRTIPITVTN